MNTVVKGGGARGDFKKQEGACPVEERLETYRPTSLSSYLVLEVQSHDLLKYEGGLFMYLAHFFCIILRSALFSGDFFSSDILLLALL